MPAASFGRSAGTGVGAKRGQWGRGERGRELVGLRRSAALRARWRCCSIDSADHSTARSANGAATWITALSDLTRIARCSKELSALSMGMHRSHNEKKL